MLVVQDVALQATSEQVQHKNSYEHFWRVKQVFSFKKYLVTLTKLYT